VPALTAHVVIDNAVAARLAQLLAPAFGGLIDRKLTEGFRVTARVAEWALAEPTSFCAWLAASPLPPERRAAPPPGIPTCAVAADASAAGAGTQLFSLPAR
jgi:hypothetical protein